MLNWLRKLIQPTTRTIRRPVRARYDAAQTTDENQRHWAYSDSLSAKSANTLTIRQTLRNRARYEFANNGYCHGLIITLANDLIGTGPRLQVQTDDAHYNRAVELAWSNWTAAVGLVDKLHVMTQAKKRDGEAFAVFVTNETLPNPVQIDLRLVECDQVTTPTGMLPSINDDGLVFDASGNVVGYHVLRFHPGDTYSGTLAEFDTLPARSVIHWYRADRPGQFRGVPEITPSLPLFGQLRRYTLATLTAAETAANFAAVLESQAPPDGTTEEPTPFETLEIERGMMTTLPAGAKLSQFAAQHPTTLYQEFKRELLKEIGRPLSAPFNVISGDSSPYNYSSARLDHLLYRQAQRVERDHCRRIVLERVFQAWVDEAQMVPGLLPSRPGTSADLPRDWIWPGAEAIDPEKEAKADTERLGNNTTTLAEILAGYGQDWESFLRQRAREQQLITELGLGSSNGATSSQNAANQPNG
jgi:lambda family phage portal protein